MERLWRLSLFNMTIEECLVKDSEQAQHLVEEFQHQRTELVASGLLQFNPPMLEARVERADEFNRFFKTVIIQVLDSCLLKLGDWRNTENRDDRFLHDLTVNVWATDLCIEQLTWERTAMMQTNYCNYLLVMLDRPFLVSALHASKNGHLAFVMDYRDYYQLLEESSFLRRRIDEALVDRVKVQFGMTEQQRTEDKKIDRIRRLLPTSLFDNIHGLRARLGQVVSASCVTPFLKQGWWTGAPFLLDFRGELHANGLVDYLNKPGLMDEEFRDNNG